ncbi:MAG: glycosyltransferase family 39 protein [Planctomycetes bacterium]|nr:glycosyltransferase family 39 protein [Planctomycetota bacterium]
MTGPAESARLCALLAIAFALRCVAAWGVGEAGGLLFPDERSYDGLARGLVETGQFGEEGGRAAWPPLYPVFLALLYSVFGPQPMAMRLAQAFLGTATVWLAWRAARAAGGARAGFWGALLVALWPHGTAYAGLLLTETLATFLLMALLCLLSGASMRSSRSEAVGLVSGAVAGFLTLTRPSLVFLPIPLAFAWRARSGASVRSLACLALAYGMVVGAWVARNAAVVGAPVLTTKMGHDLYEGIGREADGGPIHDRVRWDRVGPGRTEVERNRGCRRSALADATSDPWRVLALVPVKWARFWNPFPNRSDWRRLAVAAGTAVPVLLWLPLALVAASARGGAAGGRSLFWIPALYLTAVHSVFLASIRYRLPAEVPLAVLAACALAGRPRQGA